MQHSTIFHRAVIALLACVICGMHVSAQETQVDGTGASQPASSTAAENPTPVRAASDTTMMPDIVGTWRVRIVSPDITTGPLLEMEIRRVPLGFQIDQPWTEDAKRLQVRWLEGRGRFEGAWEADGDRHKITLQPLADGETLRVVVANRLNQSAKEASKDSGPEDKSIGNLSTQDWTRISKSLSTTFPEKRYGMPVTLTPSEPDTRLSRTDPREVRALPNTPAAKQLAEQLGAQESAAAAEAATIRQLQANGQAEQNRQAIAEHQRKLKNLLSTAFDLKLQWEELQVQELQSRLSRLERQIGQRKELREKIIDRRAGELIEGDALKWSPTTPATGRENVGGVAERSVTEPAPATDTDLPKTSDEHSSSSPPSYQEFAKKLGTLNSSVVEAEEDLKLAEEKVAAQIEPTEIVTKARRRVAEAIRNRKAIQDEYAAVLRDLELQIESARAEVDATKTVPFESGSQKDTAAEEHRLRQAKLAPERLKVRYDLYKKAGEGVAADDPLIPTLSPMVVIDRRLDAEAAAKLIWDKVGLKFGEPVTAEKIGSQGKKYRGGMPIVEVRDAESAEKKAFSKGDLLVGLDKWETTSLNNVVWILKQFETVPKPDQTDWLVKFFVIREGATKYGFLRVEGQPTGTSKIAPPQSTAKSLDEWLVILRNDCDRQQVINAVRGVTSQATAADAERAMSALLAAAEFVDFSDQTQASVVQELMLTMRKLDQSGKTLAIIRALRDGPPRSRHFAINSVGPFKNITTDKEFPALAEQVLIVAAGEDLSPRVIALGLLGETLAVTKLDPAAVSTEERREMVRQLAVNVPHNRVHQLVATALNAKQVDVALAAAEQFARLPAETMDAKVQAKLVEVLANVIKGKLGDVVASRDQRAQALTALISLNTRGAPAFHSLMEVLKSDAPDLKPNVGTRFNEDAPFTRERIIKALEGISLAVKDALPELEAALAILEKMEKEDALFSPKTRGRGQSPNSTSERLRQAISNIKAQSSSAGGHRS